MGIPSAFKTARRVMVLRVSASLLCQFFKDGTGLVRISQNALPADARIVIVLCEPISHGDADYPGASGILFFIIESESYERVQPGEEIPEAPTITMTQQTAQGFA